MISVTVAAHGRAKRVVGAHLRGYGSGRLSICDLDSEPLVPDQHDSASLTAWKRCCKLVLKVLDLLTTVLRLLLPFLFKAARGTFRPTAFPKKLNSTQLTVSPIQKITEANIREVFSYLDAYSIVCCESVCKRWNKAINKNIHSFPKIPTDQIRMLFDEGEVVIYPVDEKRCPTRYQMPSLQVLGGRLKHLTTESLFVRGLIPIESSPVLRLLNSIFLRPQQIYFIWSKFSPDSISLLETLILSNSETVNDFGLEECTPSPIFTDQLLSPVVSKLTSLRLWNNGKSPNYAVTDVTVFAIAKSIARGLPVGAIDLSTCNITHGSVIEAIQAWTKNPTSDLSISLSHCPFIDRKSILDHLAGSGIYFDENRLRLNGFTLTFFC